MIGFAGLSHLGIVSSAAAAAKGFSVVGFDPDAALCERLQTGRLPVVEPDLPELLGANRSRLRFTADALALGDCEVVFLALDVPTDDRDRGDLTGVQQLFDQLVRVVRPGTTLVVLSQVPPGFTRALAVNLRPADATGLPRLFYEVETLVFGRAVERALHPERFIVGCEDPEAPLPAAYGQFLAAFGCPILPMRYESAELAKVSINMLLASAVSTTNVLAELCEAVGADWAEIAPALRLDRRIGSHAYLTPGLGLGGGNLLRDLAVVAALAAELGTDAGLIDAWLRNSRRRREWVLKVLHVEALTRVADPQVAIWGLTYKEHTASTKNSPALALVDALRPFAIRTYDPEARLEPGRYPHVVQCGSAVEACHGADALAIMTAWPEFPRVDLHEVRRAMRGRVLVDPFGLLKRGDCERLGLKYFRLGVRNAYADVLPC